MDISQAGLDPRFFAKLQAIQSLSGVHLDVTSGFRSIQEQTTLYDEMKSGQKSGPVAAPGSSMHNYGLAVDVSPASAAVLNQYGQQFGLTLGSSFSDPLHFDDRVDMGRSGATPTAIGTSLMSGSGNMNATWYNPLTWGTDTVTFLENSGAWLAANWVFIVFVILGLLIISIGAYKL